MLLWNIRFCSRRMLSPGPTLIMRLYCGSECAFPQYLKRISGILGQKWNTDVRSDWAVCPLPSVSSAGTPLCNRLWGRSPQRGFTNRLDWRDPTSASASLRASSLQSCRLLTASPSTNRNYVPQCQNVQSYLKTAPQQWPPHQRSRSAGHQSPWQQQSPFRQ